MTEDRLLVWATSLAHLRFFVFLFFVFILRERCRFRHFNASNGFKTLPTVGSLLIGADGPAVPLT